jgi:hypothetical protein
MALPMSSALKLALEQRHIAEPLVLASLTRDEVIGILGWDNANPLHEELELVLASAISLENRQLRDLVHMTIEQETDNHEMNFAFRILVGLLARMASIHGDGTPSSRLCAICVDNCVKTWGGREASRLP